MMFTFLCAITLGENVLIPVLEICRCKVGGMERFQRGQRVAHCTDFRSTDANW